MDKKDVNIWFQSKKEFSLQFEKDSLSLYGKLGVCWNVFRGTIMNFQVKGEIKDWRQEAKKGCK